MAKIRITMEAEISDLSCYFPDDPKGVTVQNVSSLIVRELLSAAQEKKLVDMTRKEEILTQYGRPEQGQAVFDAIMKHDEQDVVLCQRLVKGARTELKD